MTYLSQIIKQSFKPLKNIKSIKKIKPMKALPLKSLSGTSSINHMQEAQKEVQKIIEQSLQGLPGMAGLKNVHPIFNGLHEDPGAKAVVSKEPTDTSFIEKKFSSIYGNRDYKLYIPSARPSGMIVMLHGCTQNPDDFALGSQMNALAEKENFLVLYPKQNILYNQNKCWNWFKDEGASVGESKLLAEMTQAVMKEYEVDASQVYVAGMSAGAAMAVILATQYPHIYKAAGIHSGLPYKAARNINTALGAMAQGRSTPLEEKMKVPLIVFHGDQDHTVSIKNAQQIIQDKLESQTSKVNSQVESGPMHSQTIYKDKQGTVAEYWVIKGQGHTWSGGNPQGSYTSAHGPDASHEMMRFFRSVKKS